MAVETAAGSPPTNAWTVIQTNIDGAVTGPASSTSGNVASYSGTTGKHIVDSGVVAANIVTNTTASSTANNLVKYTDIAGKVIADSGISTTNLVTMTSTATSGAAVVSSVATSVATGVVCASSIYLF